MTVSSPTHIILHDSDTSSNKGKTSSGSDESNCSRSVVSSKDGCVSKKRESESDKSSSGESEDESTVVSKSTKGNVSAKKKSDSLPWEDSDDSDDSDDEGVKVSLTLDHKKLFKQIRGESETLKNVNSKSDATISLPIHSDVKGVSYGVVIIGFQNATWYMDPNFMGAHCTCAWKINFPDKKVPPYLATLARYYIRREPHGDNSLLRNSSKRAKSMIGWVYQLPSADAIKPGEVEKLVKNQSDFIRACFRKSKDYSIGSLMLDYIEENSGEDQDNRGVKGGLYKAVTKGVTDTTGIVTRMTKEINNYFAAKPSFECDGHLDKYLTDADIKEFLEKYIGANN